ncbi:uncharacterized protein LOC128655288 [Bombina bombina]|uniref:uncharacterized protein LOC128655288 n=1 Tax=Bombina bombina TaxID=8345 RepID=UPI00235B1908|nr:uncharacterized protein LOC128655288 [Bombina bombina]
MGSGSSKLRRTVHKNSCRPFLRTTEVPSGDKAGEEKAPCKNEAEICAQFGERNAKHANLPTEAIHGDCGAPVDRDDEELQLLDEILAESEDCLSWKGSVSKAIACAKVGPEPPVTPVDQVKSTETNKMVYIWSSSSECEPTDNLQHVNKENINKWVLKTKSTEDVENNNLLSRFHDKDVVGSVTYNDSEEALMDSIAQEFCK